MKYTALCIALICAFLIIPFASAALSAGNVALTLDEAVRRSNPLLTRSDSELDDSSELSYVTFNIPVTASGQAETINSVTPVLSGFSYDSFGNNLNSSLEFIVDTPLPMQVPAGQALTLTVRVLVPSNLDSIDSNYNDISHTVSANLLTTDGVKTPTLSF